MVPIMGNQRIILGDIEELDDKIFRLKTFYQEAMSRMGWNKYKTINLKTQYYLAALVYFNNYLTTFSQAKHLQ